MTRWHRLAVVAMIAVSVAMMVDPLFCMMAALGIMSTGVILEILLFEEVQ